MDVLSRCLENGWRRVAFIGVTKHAGKTTALNAFLRQAEQRAEMVGLCSIGLDGERLDTLLGVAKPAIEVAAGTFIASAEQALAQAEAQLTWHAPLGIASPLGEIVLAQATTAGRVLLAGVRQRQHVETVFAAFAKQGCGLHLVDGAFDRVAQAAPNLVDAAILAVGATAGKTVQDVVDAAAPLIWKFSLTPADDALQSAFAAAYRTDAIGLLRQAASGLPHVQLVPKHQGMLGLTANAAWDADVAAVFLPGALSNRLAETLAGHGRPLQIVVRHPAQITADLAPVRALYRRGHTISVWVDLPLAAIAVNPTSILGYALPRHELMSALAAVAGDIPLYDARAAGGDGR